MNCPSRTDDTLLHCDWNQNPPTLAPDLTTRHDLNGIANAREHLARNDTGGCCFHGLEQPWTHPHHDREKLGDLALGASLTQSGRPAYAASSDAGKEGGPLDHPRPTVQSWAIWLASVLFTSALISHTRVGSFLAGDHPRERIMVVDAPKPERPLASRDTCANGGVQGAVYDLPLHVAALFIILGVSTLGSAFPVLAVWFPRLRIPRTFLFCVSHFGTGVLIATAFVHLLPTAFTSLNDPCLSRFWTQDYPAMPGAIALAGIFLVTVIEMVCSPSRKACSPSSLTQSDQGSPDREKSDQSPNASGAFEGRPHMRDMGPLVGRATSYSRSIHRMREDPDRICRISSAPERPATDLDLTGTNTGPDAERQDDRASLPPEHKYRKEVMQVFLLEMGILFHSVFIGMSLSVSVGKEFVVLLIAIVFHQTFEGLALGARIAALDWPQRSVQPWMMCLAYGCTTPVGQAIGLATHSLYSPDSEVGLLLVGTMNAISAGLLIFASLVELMSEDFLSDESWKVLRGKRRVFACILVFLGAFCMSVVGAWA